MSITSDFWKEMNQSGAKVSGGSNKKTSGGSSSGGSIIAPTSTKKKKKKSVSDEFWEAMGDDDIAPVSSVASRVQARTNGGLNDIAPTTKSRKEETGRKWFQKGLFEDGYDFGDISRTILGSATDALENIGSGIIGMGEKAVDAMAYIAPYAENAQFIQNGGYYNPELQKQHDKMFEQSKKDLGKFIEKDLYDEEKIARAIISDPARKIGIDAEADSVFGEKSDALIQSGGQLLGTIGLQSVGVPWWVTTGATSFGSETENALNQGATYEEAGTSAAISAGAEILSEKLSGGISFGGKTLDDGLTKMLARGISNKLGRTAAKLGLDMVGEGAEEVFSQVASNLGSSLYKEEDITELLFSEQAFDEYLESFIGGAALGGFAGGYNAVKSNRSGVDYVSGLTENEQAVVDKVYKDRVAEAEKNGEISEKEKSKIYDRVLNEMERGYLSIDDIESALGGNTYEEYKRVSENEDSWQAEYDKLHAMKRGDMTGEQIDREAELKKLLDESKATGNRDSLRSKLGDEVFGLVKGDRLVESYNERTRRGQAFEADLTQYDAKQKAVVQKAIDSGILNNTNRTHEFVDIIAKISADKGVLFDFTNNAKLKESGFAIDGKQVNGFVTKDGITLNIDSPKAWQTTVGHEVTHVLEGTELYTELQNTLIEYAKTKGEYDSRIQSLTELYKDVKDADVNAELTADLVGEYLFTDEDFIKNLSTEHRNVFQKLYDEIKYLCKVATGSKEEIELEKVKRAFDKAYKEAGKAQGDTKYSFIGENANLSAEDKANLQTAKKMKESGKSKEEIYKETGWYTQSDGKWRSEILDEIMIPENFSRTGLQSVKDAEYEKNMSENEEMLKDGVISEEVYKKMVRLEEETRHMEYNSGFLPTFLDAPRLYEAYPQLKKVHLTFKKLSGMEGYTDTGKNMIVLDPEGLRNAGQTVREGLTHEIQHIIQGIEGFVSGTNPRDAGSYEAYRKAGGEIEARDVESRLRMTTEERKNNMPVQFSLSDSDGKQLTKEQQNFFKDSKMRDENGNLKVMYHGSQDAGFHVFDPKMSDDDTSFFFVDRNDVAASYSGTSETYEAKTIRTAEDMNNFLAEIGYDHYEAVEENGKFVLYEDGDYVAKSDTAQGIYEEFCWYEGVGNGDANYKVYLNLKNPLEVDAGGRNWNNVSREYSQEVADRYNSLTAEEKAALTDVAEWGEISIFRDAKNNPPDAVTGSAFEKMGDVNIYDLFTIAEDNFSDESIKQFAVKQMNTRDYAQKAKAEGYDGVIFKNIHDNGGYSNGSEGASTVAIAFDSNQIKSVANEKPTADPDIRFSLSESVEETKDLVALHNLTEDKLLKSLELGGLPMPSLAITKADIPHSNFGEITLVFGRETIDPKANKKNKVYSADAWTPTFPRVEYEADSKVANRVSQKLRELEAKIDDYFHTDIRRVSSGFEDYLNSQGGEEGLIQRVMDNYGMKAAYLEDTGKHIEKVTKQEEAKKDYNPDAAEKYMAIMDILGVSTADEIGKYNLKEARDNHGAELEEVYPGMTKTAMRMSRVFSAVMSYLEDKGRGPVYNTVTDGNATQKAVDDALDAEGYEAWVRNLFSGIVKDSGIYNNKEYYTPSGNRRSFKQTHLPFTLENIVKAMVTQNDGNAKNVSGFNGIKTLRAATAETFKSVAEMHQRKGRLQNRTQEEADALNDALQSRLFKVMEAIDNESGQSGERNPYIRLDTIGEIIAEIGEGGKYSVADIQRTFKQYGKNVSDDTALDVKQLLYDVTQMPVNIFEAKPQRVVSFDEAKVFVIPNNADVKLKNELLNRGYSVAEYDPNVEGDRQRVVNQFEDLKFSLSDAGEQRTPDSMSALRLETTDEVAPIADNAVSNTENVLPNAERVIPDEMAELFPDNLAPVQEELERLDAHRNQLYGALETAVTAGSAEDVGKLAAEYEEVNSRIKVLEQEEAERTGSLTDAPPEMEAPFYGYSERATVDNPFDDRDWYEVGKKRSINAYMYDNPEVKPFFQTEAMNLLGELSDTTRAERWYNDQLHYESGGEKGFGGVKRHTSQSIETLLDSWHMSYADIEKGLNAIIEDNGAENIAAAKKLEFMLNDRLLHGYKDFYTNGRIPPNQEYINMLNERQINTYSQEAFDSLMQNADMYAPFEAAPTKQLEKATPDTMDAPVYESTDKNTVKGQTTMFEPPKPNPKVANVLSEESSIAKEKSGIGGKIISALVDKGMVFENLSLKTGNHELQAKWNYTLPSNTEARAQYFMENGADGVKPLKDIKKTVDKSGKADDFFDYLYHVHNIDRMTLDDRFGVENKMVFGETVTADVSRRKATQYEKANPEFKEWANDVYAYNRHLRQLLVNGNVISQETANLWEKMYPHYVPIRRVDSKGQNISVPLDTNKTGVNNPVKRATGGNGDIQPVFSTMAQRTEQTYRAIARNAFGIELKNTLGTTIKSQENTTGVDEAVDTLVAQEDHLLKPGTMSSNPTFTVFENGEKVEFEITEDMFDALKPAGKLLGYRNEAINKAGNVRRNLLTTWNPVFALYRNPIKDLQDVAVNSQHPVKTYANVPNAIYQIATGGKWAAEYAKNGGKSNTYFDSRNNKFKAEDNIFKKAIGMPLKALENAGEFIEEIPRLAEYIASRQEGRSVERSMLDAARVTTNFAAGGDFTKFLNSHGFTFLNASVQGAAQHVRNFREAKQQGLKGYVKVLAKYTIAGLPTILLNSMLWDDDEEYEELSDYVKQSYYVVAKTKDGKFVRIPKGRTAAVMGELMEQMKNLVTGDDVADFGTFNELFWNNIAPNNPIENNILAPVGQVWNNEAWYGGDLVPSRLQKLPAEEQFDESTDSISKWLGEKAGLSPYKINYLIDQYSGGLGDVFLPMMTPEAESGDNSFMGNMLAPWKKEVTTDSVLNNKNPGNFYDLRDELEVISNSKNATEEDELRTMYMDSVSWEMSDLYAKKREIQNGDLPDDEKYEAVRETQEQINELANNALNNYRHVVITGLYSEAGDKRYNRDAESGKWYEIKPKNADGSDNWYYQKEQEVTKGLGISYEEYWNNREEYNYAYDKPGKYAIAQAVGGYDSYMEYYDVLENWQSDSYLRADKDSNGNSISGSRKEKVIDYINGLDADYGTKIILYRSVYESKADKQAYNQDIIDYLNGRDDISYEQMEYILEELGFEVDSEGNITW